jgi:Protein of unknown function (DUF3833)
MLLSACSTPQKLDDYADMKPQVDLKTYFNGPIKAWGIIQEPSGKVVSRFDVIMHGAWQGDVGTLKEQFTYYDGTKQERVWTITKLANGKYEGSASDIIDKASGETKGNAVRWAYEMNVPVKGDTYRIQFDDWMWLMNDGVMINRSYLKKFGFTVAELTLFMQKQ